ncbi:hypothetical protein QUB63_07880 [Microcoleus sp. ARI1-B5]|uniref:hypothetical protein n=1 Tax=unclassified Microcoleus TaxID=2642155 RepID=UPI002FCF5300
MIHGAASKSKNGKWKRENGKSTDARSLLTAKSSQFPSTCLILADRHHIRLKNASAERFMFSGSKPPIAGAKKNGRCKS